MAQWRSLKTLFLVAVLSIAAAGAGSLALAQEGTSGSTGGAPGFNPDLPMEVAETPPPPPVRPEGSFFEVAAEAGGNVFWVLIVLGIGALVVSLERFLSLQKGRVDVPRFMGDVTRALNEKGVNAAMEICSRNRGPVGQVVLYGLQRAGRGAEGVEKAVETAALSQLIGMRRGLGILSFVGQSAPLLGFLGTVMGLLHAFDAAVQTGRVNGPQAIGGISEAVVTTTTGIAVAILANIFINLVTARIDRVTVQMEEAGDELVDAVAQSGGRLKGRTA
jgi:biopolymer transport protein ExbB